MSSRSHAGTAQLGHLVGLAWQRSAGSVRRPSAKLLLGVAIPAIVFVSALLTLGRVGVPAATGPAGGLTLGLLVSGILSFLAYGIIFGASDNLLLRRLGVRGDSIFLERCIRLAAVGGLAALGLTLPYSAAGHPIGAAFWIGGAASSAAVGTAAVAYAFAARAAARGVTSRVLSAGMRQWDPELARAAPLVYAPLLPFLVGAAAGAFAGGAERGWLVFGAAVVFEALAIVGGGAAFGPVAGLFLPRAAEMAYSPPPEGGGEQFRVGRGLSALLPRRAAAVWVRDAAVGGRRFGWAARITWPVAIVAIVALARWGDSGATHVWVIAAVGLALAMQAAAVVGLGVLERHGPRWIDQSTGISWVHRYLGRWAWSWGLSLWLLVPVALAWAWWSGRGGAVWWPVAGAIVAAVATGASLLNAERR